MSEPFLGEIRLLPYNFAPRGWAFCQGQLLAINQNQALFSLLGTFYGGNGQTTFALPDLRGRAAISQGNGPGLSPYNIGEVLGTESVTLQISQMPGHTHGLFASTNDATSGKPANRFLSNGGQYTDVGTGTAINPAAIGPAGGSQPFSIVQPILVLSYCIALTGIFPSRN